MHSGLDGVVQSKRRRGVPRAGRRDTPLVQTKSAIHLIGLPIDHAVPDSSTGTAGGQRVRSHRQAGEGAGLLADDEGARHALAVAGQADGEAAHGVALDAERVEDEAAERHAATMPVTTTITALSDGMPPIFSLMPIATAW